MEAGKGMQKWVDELEKELELLPGFQKTKDRYRIIANSERIMIQRKNWLGFWLKVRSSSLRMSIGGSWCDAASLSDARVALIRNIEQELRKIESRKHGWKVLI